MCPAFTAPVQPSLAMESRVIMVHSCSCGSALPLPLAVPHALQALLPRTAKTGMALRQGPCEFQMKPSGPLQPPAVTGLNP